MDHLLPLGNVAGDLAFNGVPVRPIVSGDDLLSLQTRKPTRDLGKEVAMTHRPVQVDQQAGRHRGVERSGECLGDLPTQLECASIPTAVAFQQSLVTGKEGRVGRRHFASAVLAADHKTRPVHRLVVNPNLQTEGCQMRLNNSAFLAENSSSLRMPLALRSASLSITAKTSCSRPVGAVACDALLGCCVLAGVAADRSD